MFTYLREVLVWLSDTLLDILEWISRGILSHGRDARGLRWVALSLFLGVAWAGFAYQQVNGPAVRFEPGIIDAQARYVFCTFRSAIVSDPARFSRVQRCYATEISRSYSRRPLIFELPFELLFRAGTFRHVLLAGFAFWLALKVAGEYLRGLYRLPAASCGEHYLLQSALINPYNVLRIRDGFVERADEKLPIHLIGGPGRVRVYAENAALFEKIDGTPHVFAPTHDGHDQTEFVDGFERLRSIIDLRDQRDKFTVEGRSQDGIRVTAEDVEVVYSIYRENLEPTYEQPYPFQNPKAVESLVYLQGLGPWNIAMGVQIRGELWDFFAKNSLNEFLAMIEGPEEKTMQQHEDDLSSVSRRLSGEGDPEEQDKPKPATPISVATGLDFVPRPKITQNFYDSASIFANKKGTQINWIGVGDWKFPAQLILGRHRDAWQITHDNQVRSKKVVLNTLRKQQRLYEALRLIQTVPIATFSALRKDETPVDDLMRAMILAYHHQLNEAYQDYLREIELARDNIAKEKVKLASAQRDKEISDMEDDLGKLNREMAKIQHVLRFLSRFTGRWL